MQETVTSVIRLDTNLHIGGREGDIGTGMNGESFATLVGQWSAELDARVKKKGSAPN